MKQLILILSLALVLCGCAGGKAPETTAPVTVPPTMSASVPTTQATEPQPDWDDNIHSGLRQDGTFTEGTLFIGDSLTYGFVKSYLQEFGLVGDAKYMAVVGAPLGRFFSAEKLGSSGSALYSPEFHGLSYSEAAAGLGENATAIYLMLGTNYNSDTDTDHYIQVVDYLLEHCPNATVHLQKIPLCGNEHVDVSGVNDSLEEVLAHYLQQDVQRVMLIDTLTAIGLSQGFDGIHLNADGMDAWYMAIAAHAHNNHLPE